ncbi:MAG: hypothetical protein ACRBCK_00360 [Alphaproteobacteria bacterium]
MNQSSAGNALFYILMAIALLAALSFAIAQSGRNSVQSLTDEQASLYATEVIEYANILTQAVTQIRLRGYDEDEISFENSSVSGYVNPNCNEDGCKIFHLSGGGVHWGSPSLGVNDGSDWLFTGQTCIEDVGTGDTGSCNSVGTQVDELIMFLPNVDVSVCAALNDKLGIDNVAGLPPQESQNAYDVASNQWIGSFQNNYAIGGVFKGLRAGCFEGGGTVPAPGTYHYYNVLIAR